MTKCQSIPEPMLGYRQNSTLGALEMDTFPPMFRMVREGRREENRAMYLARGSDLQGGGNNCSQHEEKDKD